MAIRKDPPVVIAGETFTLTTAREKREFTVQPKGDGCSKGCWICTTCDAVLIHNMAKECHLRERPKKKAHRFAWFCHEHDCAEVP